MPWTTRSTCQCGSITSIYLDAVLHPTHKYCYKFDCPNCKSQVVDTLRNWSEVSERPNSFIIAKLIDIDSERIARQPKVETADVE